MSHAGTSVPPVTSTPSPSEADLAVVWPEAAAPDITRQVIAACAGNPGSDTCRSTILDLGGSDEAVDLYQQTSRFVTAAYPAGPVDVGLTVTATGGNYSFSPLILGTSSGTIDLTDELPTGNLHDPIWPQLKAAYPRIGWPGTAARIEVPVVEDDGSAGITYDYDFTNGCHGCETLAIARVTFTFAPDGSLQARGPAMLCGGPLMPAATEFHAPLCPMVVLDPSTPTESPAATPTQAVEQLVNAWRNGDRSAAAAVASAGPIHFLWHDFKGGNPDINFGCEPWGATLEQSCSLGVKDGIGVAFAVTDKASTGWFVGWAGYGE
jgi:hypothetical protein